MKNQDLSYIARFVSTFGLAAALFSLIIIGSPTTTANTTAAPVMVEITKELVNQESDKYTRAVNAIKSISSMSLKTEADFKKASTIIETHAKNLSRVRARMVQIALSNATFTKSLQTEFEQQGSDDVRMLRRFRREPGALINLSGAPQAQNEMSTVLREDYQGVKTAAEALKEAAAARRRHHANYKLEPPNLSSSGPVFANNFFETLFLASDIYVGVIKKATKAPARRNGGTGGGGTGGGSSSSGSLLTSYTLDEAEYDSCMQKADSNRTSCKQRCEPGILEWLCTANCQASYLLAKIDCSFSSVH